MPRCFVALDLPPPLVEVVGAWQAAVLELAGPDARLEPASRLHVTLAFLGSVDDALVDPLAGAVAAAVDEVGGPLALALDGTCRGYGGRRAAPGVWALPVVDEHGALARLHAALWARLEPLGFRPEPRPYSPHVTVVRRPAGPPRGLPPCGPVAFSAASASLQRSVPGPGGSVYTALSRTSLSTRPTTVPALGAGGPR